MNVARGLSASIGAGLLVALAGCGGLTEPDPSELCPVAGVSAEVWTPEGQLAQGGPPASSPAPEFAARRIPPTPPLCARLAFDLTWPDTTAYPGEVHGFVTARAATAIPDWGIEAGDPLWSDPTARLPEDARITNYGPPTPSGMDVDVWMVAGVITVRRRPNSTTPSNLVLATDSVRMPLRFRPTMAPHPAQRIRIDLSR